MACYRQHPAFGDQWDGQAIDSSLSLATEMPFVDAKHWIFSTFQQPQLWWTPALFWKWMPPSFPRGCPHLPHSGCVSAGNRWQALEDDSCLRTKPYWHMGITDWNGFSAICHWRGKLGWFNSTNLISSFYCLFSTCRETFCSIFFYPTSSWNTAFMP